jgi:uncharacterized RDD family membrane protein YckC
VYPYAGLPRRIVAYFVDALPITLVVLFFALVVLGHDDTARRHFRAPGDRALRMEYLKERALIRNLSMVLYCAYCALCESSPWRGTLGKRLMGLAVVDVHGRTITFGQSWKRNAFKVLSFLPLGLGIWWALGSERRQTWHDRFARTVVVHRDALE